MVAVEHLRFNVVYPFCSQRKRASGHRFAASHGHRLRACPAAAWNHLRPDDDDGPGDRPARSLSYRHSSPARRNRSTTRIALSIASSASSCCMPRATAAATKLSAILCARTPSAKSPRARPDTTSGQSAAAEEMRATASCSASSGNARGTSGARRSRRAGMVVSTGGTVARGLRVRFGLVPRSLNVVCGPGRPPSIMRNVIIGIQ